MLGRSRECDVRVSDVNVSRRHAEVRQEGDDVLDLVDLGSTNGTLLNGKRVDREQLSRRRHDHARLDGDRLRRRAVSDGRARRPTRRFSSSSSPSSCCSTSSSSSSCARRRRTSAGRPRRASCSAPPTRPQLRAAARARARRASSSSRARASRRAARSRSSGVSTRRPRPRSAVRLDGDEFASARHARIDPRAGRRLGRGSRLDERHVRERRRGSRRSGSCSRATSLRVGETELGSNEVRTVRLGRAAGVTDTGPEAAPQRGRVHLRAAAVRGRGRHGRRARRARSPPASPRPRSRRRGSGPRGADGIAALIVEANRRIWERSLDDPATAGMGTTVTAALVDEQAGAVVIGHVGDSRAYRVRDGELEQLTTDHSLVAELVESGVLTPEEAERHPQRSAITRALGTEPTVERRRLHGRRPSPATSSCSARTGSRTWSPTTRSPSRDRARGRRPDGARRGARRSRERARAARTTSRSSSSRSSRASPSRSEDARGAPTRAAPATDGAGAGVEAADAAAGRRDRRAAAHARRRAGRPAAPRSCSSLAVLVRRRSLVLYWGITR